MRDAEKQSIEAIEHLRKFIKPGDTVYTVLRHVSRSGMSWNIDLYLIHENEPMWISAYVGKAIGRPQSRKNWEKSQGLTVGGCGMDMGFELVYSLGRAMFPGGFAPSNIAIRPSDGKRVNVDVGRGISHSKAVPFSLDRPAVTKLANEGWQFAGGRNGDTSGWDNDGGYALTHKWL